MALEVFVPQVLSGRLDALIDNGELIAYGRPGGIQ